MKTIITIYIYVFALLISIPSQSQPQDDRWKDKTPQERADMMTEMLKNKLALTDDQTTAVYNLNLNFVTKADSLRSADMEPTEKRKTLKSYHDEREKALKEILTEEQYAQHLVMRKERRDERQGKRKGLGQDGDKRP